MNWASAAVPVFNLRLKLSRFGWERWIVCALFVFGATSWGWLIPAFRAESVLYEKQIQDLRHAYRRTPDAPASAEQPLAAVRLAAFYANLAERTRAERHLETMFNLAAAMGLSLGQGEYKVASDKNGRFNTYQISLPVKGDYRSIRGFCYQALLDLPFASLDEISMKRDGITAGAIEARLRFTFYLRDSDKTARKEESPLINEDKT